MKRYFEVTINVTRWVTKNKDYRREICDEKKVIDLCRLIGDMDNIVNDVYFTNKDMFVKYTNPCGGDKYLMRVKRITGFAARKRKKLQKEWGEPDEYALF